ncbi:ammonia-forming cytochrome c nitrite reductase [Desulfosarcina sp. OttesenSCG-928-B08]|nr:ammonia-forming cytochrome c nitrite reductase [Desulfosarcina sp. OttesenSCG-928-B08]
MKLTDFIKQKPGVSAAIVFVVGMVAIILVALLAASITFRRAEVASIYNNVKVKITGTEARSDIWGQNYPREWGTWKKTRDMDFKSKHLGNMPEDVLDTRPDMVVLWAGYAFSRDYSAPRGHGYAIDDMRATLRTGAPMDGAGDLQPGTCWTCKSPDVPRMMKEVGVENFYKGKWSDFGAEVVNPIGCADCHDPDTMNLTITRPALVEAFQRQGKDIRNATLQEMRSLVCAQCHVEYYFKGDGKYLTFPWDQGMSVEAMEAYYDTIEFTDWTHGVSKTSMLKAQHPDYELFLLGTHGQRGVSCADCHMPYISEGGVKYSDHHVMSPLKNVSSTCQTCHRDSEANLKNYVYERQDKVLEIRNRLEPELAKAHIMAKLAWDSGATAEEMAGAQKLIRQAQWRWDFGVASHGASFHAPIETQRVLSHGLDKALQAQLALKDVLFSHGVTEVVLPDISTKEKAQAYIGLDMTTLKAQKKSFMEKVVPEWINTAIQKNRLSSANDRK